MAVLLFSACASPESPTADTSAATQSAALEQCDLTLGTPARWTTDEVISPCGRTNPLGLADPDSAAVEGRKHALVYPVDSTGILIPYHALLTVVEGDTSNPIRKLLAEITPLITGIHGMSDLWHMLGLAKDKDNNYWGVTVMDTPNGQGVTFSCATCHTGHVFGTPIFGLHNRQSRANHMFVLTKPVFRLETPGLFAFATGASAGEQEMWRITRDHMNYVRSVEPRAIGLDTALAHTMVSMMTRQNDPWLTKTDDSWRNPRYNELETHPSDVKPATWWLTKYKTKFFSDASLVSSNPVIGSLIVNELSRGADLHTLDTWLDTNKDKIDALTTAVFSAKPPSYFDFFDAKTFDMEAAKRGQVVFKAHCEHCHGQYAKGWDDPSRTTRVEQLATTDVRYFSQTKARDVGTDPNRAQAIQYMQEMNALDLAKKHNFVLTPQSGYVPPPLVGIWARWPYFHNGSAQSLCAVLTRASDRPVQYVYGEVLDRDREFDQACNGYPTVAPDGFEDVYDTTMPGLAATGHDEGIFLKDGVELLSAADKSDLIRYLLTL